MRTSRQSCSRRRKEADSFVAAEVTRRTKREPPTSSRRRLRAQRWSRRRRQFGLALGNVQFPKQFPISFLHRMNIWVAGNDGAAERPISLFANQLIAYRIGQRVKAETRKRVSFPFLLAQDVIVWLMLPLTTVAQSWLKVGAEKLHGVELIALLAYAHPDEMKMVGHQAVGWAEKSFSGGGMEHQFTKLGVQGWCQPSTCARLQRIRPKHHGMTLILMSFQSREFAFARWSHNVDMDFAPRNVKTVAQSTAPIADDVRRRTQSTPALSTSSRRWLPNPPPYVGGYDAP